MTDEGLLYHILVLRIGLLIYTIFRLFFALICLENDALKLEHIQTEVAKL